MAHYVYSKMSAAVDFNIFRKGGADMPIKDGKITIHGGAGVANKNLITPNGVVTEVTDEELEILNAHPLFIQFKENGYISVEKKKVDVEKVVANMGDKADPSAPISPADYAGADEKTATPKK